MDTTICDHVTFLIGKSFCFISGNTFMSLSTRHIFFSTMVLASIMTAGCSAIIIALDEGPPELENISNGIDRSIVENKLGRPLRECTEAFGKTMCSYEYNYQCPNDGWLWYENVTIGDKSLNILNTVINDLRSLFIVEFITTPVLLWKCGDESEITISYDAESKVVDWEHHPPDVSDSGRVDNEEP